MVTRGIKHWGLSGYLSILPRIKFDVTGQVSSPQSLTAATLIRYMQPKETKISFTFKNKNKSAELALKTLTLIK